MITKVRPYMPLLGFVLPTLIIGYGFVIPRSCIHGINELSIGFGTTILGAAATYVAGVRSASRTSCPVRPPLRRRIELYINRQAANPHGLFGRFLGVLWPLEHRLVNRETLGLMHLESHHRVLEVGCGPGWALRQAAVIATAGHAVGLDVSETMLAIARRTNSRAIAGERVSLRRIDGATLGVEPGTFDRAFAVHCLYFWKKPSDVIAQLYEALRVGGQVVLAFLPESDKVPPRFRDEIYRFHSAAEVEGMLVRAGFGDVRIVRKSELGVDLVWAIATKPVT